MTVPYSFASRTTAIPLSELDSNFNTPVTIGNTAVTLGNTVTTLNNMTLANVTVSSYNASSAVTPEANGGTGTTTGYYGFKNRIINGAMMIDQRNAGASVTPATGTYTVDRWQVYSSQASKLTVQQNAGSVTPPAGFTNYLGITSSSAYSVVSTDTFSLRQYIEGYNVADLNFGTASAATVTISFWVRSSLTGSFGAVFWDGNAGTSCYPFTYTINAANTWEQKTVTIAGRTSGTWLTNNSGGACVQFALGTGSNYTGTANAWTSSTILAPTGSTNLVGTNGATFYITGVQLEKGSTATSFDYRPYGTELALCQRYYVKTYNQGTIAGTATANGALFQYRVNDEVSFTWQFPQVMRTTPTLTFYGKDTGTSGKVSCGSTEFNGGTNGTVNGDKNNIIYASGLSGSTDCYVQAVATAEL